MNPQVDKKHYFRKKYDDLGRFISYFHQVDTVANLDPKTILEVGKGNGTLSDYLKKFGYSVTTCDFDKNLAPDVVADVRKMPLADNSYELVTAFEILEHLPFEEFPKALTELRRVSSRYVVISLPYKSTGFEWVMKFPGVRTLFGKSFLDFFFRIPLKFGGIEVSGQHYWEIDRWNFRLGKVRAEIEKQFKVLKEFRPALNHYHYFFVLER
jgi:ubiquinone/menaquinone biosynthesis C-methylase UbiE